MARFCMHQFRSLVVVASMFTATAAWSAPPTYTFKSLGTLGGTSSTADGVNDFGEVVGVSTLADGTSAPYLYTEADGLRNLNAITEGPLERPGRILFGLDGKLYVINGGNGPTPTNKGSVVVFDAATGDFLYYLVQPGSGGLQNCSAGTFGPDGNLYIHSGTGTGNLRDRILQFDGETGAYLGDFVQQNAGGFTGFSEFTFGPDLDDDGYSDLFVTATSTDEIVVYSGHDGTFLRVFVSAGSGGLDYPGTLLFHDLDGDSAPELIVLSMANAQVLVYNGQTGAFLSTFVDLSLQADSNRRMDDIQFGPDGDLYVADRAKIGTNSITDDQNQIWRCDGQTGEVTLFIPTDNGGWACAAPQLSFDGIGTVYVNSGDTNQIFRFEGPLSANPGQFLDVFIDGVCFELITAYDINNAGQIVGHGYKIGRRGIYSQKAAYRYTPPAPGRLVGRVDNLGLPNTWDVVAVAINDDGDVAGGFINKTTNRWHAFLWTPEQGAIDLGTLNGTDTRVASISNRSGGQIQVAGWAGASGKERAWRYSTATGVMKDLGLLGGKSGYSKGWDMNNLGMVVGPSTNGSKLRAFVYNTSMQDVGTLGGNNSIATGINDFGDIVGTADTTTKGSTNKHQAFVRMNGVGMFKLEPQIVNLPGSMNLKIAPWRINNVGQIIGPGGPNPSGTAYLISPQ